MNRVALHFKLANDFDLLANVRLCCGWGDVGAVVGCGWWGLVGTGSSSACCACANDASPNDTNVKAAANKMRIRKFFTKATSHQKSSFSMQRNELTFQGGRRNPDRPSIQLPNDPGPPPGQPSQNT